jgi:hypothetical protein
MPRSLMRWMGITGSMSLALGLGAALLYLQAAGAAEYQPLIMAGLGLDGLAIGYLLGQVIRPLRRGHPPVPATADAAATPSVGWALLGVRGFAAGFWTLAALGIGATLLYDAGVRIPGLGPILFPATWTILLVFALTLCAALPVATAHGMVLDGAGLSRTAPIGIAAAAYLGGWSMFLLSAGLLLLQPDPAIGENLAGLIALVALPVAVAGTPALARGLRPALGRGWTVPLMLVALAGAWLLGVRVNGWINPMGPGVEGLWLLPLGLLWGSCAGALPAMAIAHRRAARVSAAGDPPRRLGLLAMALGGAGLILLGLIALGAWGLFTLAAPPPPATAPPAVPSATQPASLRLPAPALVDPVAGATLTGPTWNFHWNPPSGANAGQVYQFTLWSPDGTCLTQFLTTSPQAQVAVAPETVGRYPGTWTWRVRLVQIGQGAGQWSEARPFTPGGK